MSGAFPAACVRQRIMWEGWRMRVSVLPSSCAALPSGRGGVDPGASPC